MINETKIQEAGEHLKSSVVCVVWSIITSALAALVNFISPVNDNSGIIISIFLCFISLILMIVSLVSIYQAGNKLVQSKKEEL